MNKIEEFFFDIIGLLLPGILFAIMVYVIRLGLGTVEETKSILSFSARLTSYYNSLEIPEYISVVIMILVLYLIGHIIKVMSKYFYNLMKILMDDFTMIPIMKIKKISSGWKQDKFLVKVMHYILNLILESTTFRVKSYSSGFEGMYKNSKEMMNSYYEVDFYQKENSWYQFYKTSLLLADESNVNTHARLFLVKYNFYRSISFISVIHLIITLSMKDNMGSIMMSYFNWIIILDIIIWITFHSKYKRYWIQCGNEAILGAFHSLNKGDNNTA